MQDTQHSGSITTGIVLAILFLLVLMGFWLILKDPDGTGQRAADQAGEQATFGTEEASAQPETMPPADDTDAEAPATDDQPAAEVTETEETRETAASEDGDRDDQATALMQPEAPDAPTHAPTASSLTDTETPAVADPPAAPSTDTPASPPVPPVPPVSDTSDHAAAETEDGAYRTRFAVKVRSCPSRTCPSTGTLPAGERLDLAGDVDPAGWSQVAAGEGIEGYVFTPLLRGPAGTERRSSYVVLQDCPDCPDLVYVSNGSFAMGSAADAPAARPEEMPRRDVVLSSPFLMGRYEVTRGEWKACVEAGGCGAVAGASPGEETEAANDALPVMGVSWTAARRYTAWLSQTTGRRYRLPTEAEWEYAARAGQDGPYGYGQRLSRRTATVGAEGPTAVGATRANAFGLHDMHGNASEWVSDCWSPSHDGAPSDGRPRRSRPCVLMVIKGGSWRDRAEVARAAARRAVTLGLTDTATGFRVARDL